LLSGVYGGAGAEGFSSAFCNADSKKWLVDAIHLQKPRGMKVRFTFCLVLILTLGASRSYAATNLWLGTSGTWSAGSWSLGVPANDGSADLSFGVLSLFTSTVDTNYTINSLTITSTALGFTLGNSSSSTLTIGTSFTDNSNSSVDVAVPLLGAMTLNVGGSGTLTLHGTNSYTGYTYLSSGVLADASANAFSSASVVEVGTGATLQVNHSETIAALNDNTGGGSVVLASGATLDMNGGYSGIFSGVISGSGNLQKDVTGTLTLTGANTYIGTTVINGVSGTAIQLGNGTTQGSLATSGVSGTGTLAFHEPGSLTFGAPLSGALQVIEQGPGAITLTGANTNTGGYSIVSGTTLSIGDGTTGGSSIAGNVLDNGTLTFAPSLTDTSTYTGVISGSGAVIVNGANNGSNIGSIALSAASTYTGGTHVTGGELFVGGSTVGAPGSITSGPVGTGTLVFDNGTEFSPLANVTLANAIAFNGTVDNDDGGGNSMTLSGLISGGGTYSWCTWSALNITGIANTFSGTMDMREGYLYLGSDTALGTASVILDGGTSIDAFGSGVTRTISNAIYITSSTAQIGNGNNNNLTFSGVIAGSGPAVITVDNGTAGSVTFSGANTLAGTGTTFNVNNAGTVFAANNSAFGAAANSVVLQNGSTLNVLGGILIQNPVTIGSGANTLAGNGTITNGGAALPITNNVILSPSASPGGGPGDLTFSNPMIFTGGAIHFQLYDATGSAGTGFGLITANGGINMSGATANSITFNIVSVDGSGNAANAINFNPATSYSWMFAASSSPITGFNAGDFHLVTSGFTNATGGGSFSVSESGNDLMLNFTPVPEPSTWALIGAGLAAVVPFLWRRRRAAAA